MNRACSTTVSCPKWRVLGAGRQLLPASVPRTEIVPTGHAWWIFKDYYCSEKCLPLGMEECFRVDSQNASGPSSGSWVNWCMYISSVIQQLLLFPKGSQVNFSIAELGLLWLTKCSVTLIPACLFTPSQKNSGMSVIQNSCFLWFRWRNFGC